MNATQIRILALVTMVIDHIGIFLFPQFFILRIIGRFSFPLFAWLIANGVEYTKNGRRYLARIGLLALASQAPYLLAFKLTDPVFNGWNILATLFLGLTSVLIFKRTENNYLKYAVSLVCCLVAIAINSGYGAAGVMAVIICYVLRKNLWLMTGSLFITFATFYVIPEAYAAYSAGHSILSITPLYIYQPLGAFSLLLTQKYNHKNGRSMKYFFYFFYPVHLLILYILNRALF